MVDFGLPYLDLKQIFDAYDQGNTDKTDVALALLETVGTAKKGLAERAIKIMSVEGNNSVEAN